MVVAYHNHWHIDLVLLLDYRMTGGL
jgi:hypothetical protein